MNGCLRIAPILTAVVFCTSPISQSFDGTANIQLHVRIDRAIAASHLGPCAKVAADHDFVRRIYLDLIGRSPTLQECRNFLADESPAKRVELIDGLLASDEFIEFFTGVLDVMFMERRGGNRIPQAEWIAFLRNSLKEQRPFDEIVRAMLSADGTGQSRGAAKFLLERGVEPNALTRDISRVFLGRDLQCAQCHDHPNINDYLQSEYYGIFAFINRSYLFEDATKNKQAFVGERAEGDAEFTSVFYPEDDASRAIPHLLSGLALDAEPRLDHEQAYVTEPAKTSAAIPRFSRRRQLAWLITHPANTQFSRNSVNRLWAHMMGQGLVDPVDFDHSDNPPSHPALLELLTRKFIENEFDLRQTLRQIALSDTYQRSIQMPEIEAASLHELSAQTQSLASELERFELQLADSKEECSEQADSLRIARSELGEVDERISRVSRQISEVDKQLAKLEKEKSENQKLLNTQQLQSDALREAVASSKTVSEALPKDAELAKTHADYQRRLDNVTGSLEELKKSLDETEHQRMSTLDKRGELLKELARGKSDRIAFVDLVAEARGALRVFQARRSRLLAEKTECRQHLQGLKIERAYVESVAQAEEQSEKLADLQSAPPVTGSELAQAKAKLAAIVAEIQTGKQQLDSLAEQHATSSRLHAQQEGPLDELQLAVQQAQHAAQALADASLNSAVGQLQDELASLTGQLTAARDQETELAEQLATAQSDLQQQSVQRKQAEDELRQLQTRLAEHEQNIAAARSDLQAAKVALDLASAKRRDLWERKFVVRQLNPLTPEQLAGSTIAALGLRDRFQREAESEWRSKNKEKQLELENQQQRKEIRELNEKRVAQVVSTYVSLFAAPAGAPQDIFSSTADQALFFSNDGRMQNWLNPVKGTLLARLNEVEDLRTVVDDMHLAILSRPATEQEQAEIHAYVSARKGALDQALRDVTWGLLTSAEFRFNH